MTTKPRITNILAWIIIISSIIVIWCDYFSPHYKQAMAKSQMSIIALHNFIANIAVFPSGLPWFFHTFGATPEMYFLTALLWSLLIIISSVGVLKLNNLARISLIVLSAVQIITFISSRLLIVICIPAFRKSDLYSFLIYFFTLLFPVLYIFYLTRPQNRSQFR